VGWNKLAYQQQDYIASNEFTWNYSAAGNRISSTILEQKHPCRQEPGVVSINIFMTLHTTEHTLGNAGIQ
jgi:hypothetical protein